MLPKEGDDLIVITKSMKDAMLFYELGIPSIAPCSENLFLTDRQYNILKSKFKYCAVVYDTDIAGISSLRTIRKNYPDIICTYIPRKYEEKDLSDFYKKYGKEQTIELIERAKNYYLNGGKKRRKSKEKT